MEKLKDIIEATISNNIEINSHSIDYGSIVTCADYISKEIQDIAIGFYCKRLNIDPDSTIFDLDREYFVPISDLFRDYIADKYK